MKRGSFIVFEGIDRSGKTTQCELLVETLKARGQDVVHTRFPNRYTLIGKVLDEQLKGNQMNKTASHLLFAANRWEMQETIDGLLKAGTTVVADRYSYSGVAYSMAHGLDAEWCWHSERGLIEPDMVIYLDIDPKVGATRAGYGEEELEKLDFQIKVYKNYKRMISEGRAAWYWCDANQSKDELSENITNLVVDVQHRINNGPIEFI